MKLGTLLTSLAKKTGIDTTQQQFIDLLAVDLEVPDEIANTIDKGLMNEEAAKVKFKTVHRTEALNGIDKKVDELLTELGYSEEEIAEVKGEKNTYEKVGKLAQAIRTLEAKKAGAKSEGKEALEKKIDELNRELRTTKESLTSKESEFKNLRESDLTNFEIQKILLGKEYSLPKEMDGELVLTTAQTAINKALAAKGYKFVRNENGTLSIVDKDGNKAYSDNHEEVQPLNFIDGALAQNKLLKVNDQSQSGSGNNGNRATPISGSGNPDTEAISAIDAQMKELGIVG